MTDNRCGGCGRTVGHHRRCAVAGVDRLCPDCGTATAAIHDDDSSTCGHCYMQRAEDLGVIPKRKGRR